MGTEMWASVLYQGLAELVPCVVRLNVVDKSMTRFAIFSFIRAICEISGLHSRRSGDREIGSADDEGIRIRIMIKNKTMGERNEAS
jgi:hypothetical protein